MATAKQRKAGIKSGGDIPIQRSGNKYPLIEIVPSERAAKNRIKYHKGKGVNAYILKKDGTFIIKPKTRRDLMRALEYE